MPSNLCRTGGRIRPCCMTVGSIGEQQNAAASRAGLEPGGDPPVPHAVGNRTEQREVHPADQRGVVAGEGSADVRPSQRPLVSDAW